MQAQRAQQLHFQFAAVAARHRKIQNICEMQADENKSRTYIFNDFTGRSIDGFKDMAIRKPLGSCSFSDRDYSFLLLMINLGFLNLN